jgi:predicted DNA-binding transcriptional regulator AlpA
MARHSALPANLPPRLIAREAAAAYVGVSVGTFDKMLAVGTLPSPKKVFGTRKAWCVRALDRAIDALPDDGGAGDDTWDDVHAA